MMRKEPVDPFKAVVIPGDNDIQQFIVPSEFNTDGDFQFVGFFAIFC